MSHLSQSLSLSTVKLDIVYRILFLMSVCAAQVVVIRIPPENRTVYRGSDVTISCGYVTATALPVTWIINGRSFTQQEVVNSPLYQLNNPTSPMNVSLTVFSINATTTFQCIVLSTPVATSTQGTVIVIGDVTITRPPENRTVNRGDDVTISCGYMTIMAFPVTWIINGRSFTQQEIVNSPLYRLNFATFSMFTSLTVFSINSTTTFQCIVLSTPNTTSTRGTVFVIGDVIITTPPENTTVCRGSNVTISCGHLTATTFPVTWIINGTSLTQQEILNSSLYQLNNQFTPTANSFTVFPINATTTFQCVVLSTPVTISTMGTVIVIETFILQNCEVTSPSCGTIRVSCNSSHQILITLTCTNSCNNPMMTSNGYSPLNVAGLDPGIYSVIINVFDGNQVVLSDQTIMRNITVMSDHTGLEGSDNSESDSLSTGAVVAVTCVVTLIISVTTTAVITYIVTYVCVKRKLEHMYNSRHQSTQEKVLYEQVQSPSSTITKSDFELQPNPAYGTGHNVTMNTTPVYESCK